MADTSLINPWGKQYLDVDPNIFKYENGQWWDMRSSPPQLAWALNQSHPSGWLDPGNAQSRPWWSYAEMNPGLADTYRQQYGSSTQQPAGDVAPHPGSFVQGMQPGDALRTWVNPKNTGVGMGNFLPGFDPAKMGNQATYSNFISQAGYDPVTGFKLGIGPNPQTGSDGSQSVGSQPGNVLSTGLEATSPSEGAPATGAGGPNMSPDATAAVNQGSAPGIAGNAPNTYEKPYWGTVTKATGTPESRGDIVKEWLLKNTGKATL